MKLRSRLRMREAMSTMNLRKLNKTRRWRTERKSRLLRKAERLALSREKPFKALKAYLAGENRQQ